MKIPPEAVAALKALGIQQPPEGWDALDPTSPANVENRNREALERYNRAKIIADGVSDEALALMREMTVEAQTWQVHEMGLLNGVGFGILREGQNSLVRWIEVQKRIASQGPTGTGTPIPKRSKR